MCSGARCGLFTSIVQVHFSLPFITPLWCFASGGCPARILLCCYVAIPASRGGCLFAATCFGAKLFLPVGGCPVCVMHCCYVYVALLASQGLLGLYAAAVPLCHWKSGRSVCCLADMRRRQSGATWSVCCFVARLFY